jgi:branched-chain amino acid transport system substrate-binding protein
MEAGTDADYGCAVARPLRPVQRQPFCSQRQAPRRPRAKPVRHLEEANMIHSHSLLPGAGQRRARRAATALIAMLLTGLSAAPALAQGNADRITTARLGAVYAFSGPVAIYSATIKNGLDMALSELNAKGDLKLDVLMEDDRSSKDDAINVYQKFIQRDQALLIFGPLIGSQVFAAGPLAQRAKVPVMLTSVATPGITGIGDHIFRTSVESATIIPGTVKAAKAQLKTARAVQIYTNDDQFSVGEFKAYEAALKAEGVQILGAETVRTGDVDFSAQLTKIRSLNPDTLVISSQGQEAVGLITQARKLGLDKVHIIGGNAFNAAGVVKEAGAAMEGALSATPWFLAMEHPKNVAFVKAYRDRFKSDPDWLAAQTYDAVHIVKQALLAANIGKGDSVAVARSKLRNSLAAIKSYDGVLGKIEFDDKRDPRVAGAVIKVQGGKHVIAQ